VSIAAPTAGSDSDFGAFYVRITAFNEIELYLVLLNAVSLSYLSDVKTNTG